MNVDVYERLDIVNYLVGLTTGKVSLYTREIFTR